ncbi:hypothetical protein ISCGN_016245 [Ixodes scapularis]
MDAGDVISDDDDDDVDAGDVISDDDDDDVDAGDVTDIRIVIVIITDDVISDVTDVVTGIRIVIVIITDDVISDVTDDVTDIRIVIVIITGEVISDVTNDVIEASPPLLHVVEEDSGEPTENARKWQKQQEGPLTGTPQANADLHVIPAPESTKKSEIVGKQRHITTYRVSNNLSSTSSARCHLAGDITALARHENEFYNELNDAGCPGTPDIREIIREVVREELRRLLLTASRPPTLSIAEAVREEVHRVLQPEVSVTTAAPDEPTLSYAAIARRPPQAPRQATAPPRRDAPTPQYPRRQEDQAHVRPDRPARTADRRPLCYHCGEADHVYRRCPYRRLGLRGFHPNDPRPRYGERPREIDEYLRRPQSPEPASRREFRSPSPRRPASPMHRPLVSLAGETRRGNPWRWSCRRRPT